VSRSGAGNGKTPAKTPALAPQPHGGALKLGNPGNRGGGRPPDEWRRSLKALTDRPAVLRFLRRCLNGKEGPQAALKAYQYLTEQQYGKAMQTTKIEGDERAPLVIRVVRS
jgi:hypothetical protein